jgi:mono/diheme cytochrome c family protein
LKEAAVGFVPFPIVAKHYNQRALRDITPSSAPARTVATFLRRWRGTLISLALGFAPLLAVAANTADRTGIEFFEKHVRPVLVDHCYNCHSPGAEKGVKGGLLLDTRDGLLKGGDNGPAIVAGDPEKSLLIKAIRYHDENLQMPPKGKKLSDQQIEDLVAWVKMGAPDPRTTEAVQGAKSKIQSREHWAFRPVKEPLSPTIKNRKLVQTPIDQFLLAKLETKGLSLSPRADKRTLIRRVNYDLTGLPPTPEETRAFEADKSPEAFAQLVDRLLASPRYGERWGRYWLDIARYADTKGYVFEEERRYPYSYTYRDWVIRAFNEDLPYDQFLIQQIAADLLPLGDDKRPLAALGFLTLGRRFLNNQTDIIDDRIDVVTRGTMGLTVACARCHDHKFDPVPQKDYYSLYGVFASSHEPNEKPLLGSSSMPKEYPEYLAERKKREEEMEKFRKDKEDEVLAKVRAQVGDYLLVVHDATKADEDKKEGLARERKLQPSLSHQYKRALKDWQEKPHPVFDVWFAFAALPETNFAARAKEVCASFTGGGDSTNRINLAVAAVFAAENPPASLKETAERFNRLFASVDEEWRNSQTNSPAPKALLNEDREALRQILYGPGTPIMALDGGDLQRFMDTPAQQKLRALKRKLDETDATHPGAPPRAMALLDNTTPTEPVVFKRGNANNPGDKVPRQFLEVVAGTNRKPFANGSGRLEMAESIASKDNPLTARVFVNRVWMYHFGVPLVRTPSDFGLRSDPPTHPELLDYLAARFMAGNWSIKKLHRLILLSAAYQQGSDDNAKGAKIDPANELCWRMNRRRLDFEAMRDTLLAASGKLDLVAGGRADDITTEPFTTRRTVYGFVERQNLPGLFRTFDFASPDTTSPQRFNTTVPQQALFLMNSPFVVQQAKRMLERPEVSSQPGDEAKIERLYQIAFQRNAEKDELKLAKQFLASQEAAATQPEEPAWSYGYGKFNETTRQVEQFTPLPHWTGYVWQGGTNLPDTKLGWVILNADGGHVGNDQNHAAIRRWRAPSDGVVTITAELNHPSDKGDGVRAHIVSSRTGSLGEWTAKNSKTPVKLDRVEVKRGDHLDFVVDCRQTVEFDSFHWSPIIKMGFGVGRPSGGEPREWNAKGDFGGPKKTPEKSQLTAWEKYAQVLLLANELMFVD